MATALQIIRGALHEAGLDREGTNKAAREFVDNITYDTVLKLCLEQGQWNFAMRDNAVSSTATPGFGYSYSFPKPSDWIRTAGLSANGTFQPPLEDYTDHVSVWLANVNPIYIRYVSNNASFGMDLTLWPESYTHYVELELAARIASRNPNFSGNDRMLLDKRLRDAKSSALAKDAMNEASPRKVQPGRFVQSRFGRSSTRIDPLIP